MLNDIEELHRLRRLAKSRTVAVVIFFLLGCLVGAVAMYLYIRQVSGYDVFK